MDRCHLKNNNTQPFNYTLFIMLYVKVISGARNKINLLLFVSNKFEKAAARRGCDGSTNTPSFDKCPEIRHKYAFVIRKIQG